MTTPVPVSAASAATDGLSPMQSELLSRADAIFSSISAGVAKAGTFVAEQVPDIAIQYVAFGRAYNTIWLLVAITIFVAGVYLSLGYGFKNKANLANSTYGGEWHGARISAIIFGTLVSIIGFSIFGANLKETLMVWFAPKVWLIMEMAELIKKIRQ